MAKVGCDVGEATLDVQVRFKGKLRHKQFANTGAGRNDLHKWLKSLDIKEIELYMEATGRYYEKLAYWAHDLGAQIYVLNPRDVRKFAEAKLGYNKSDKTDSKAILRFAETSEAGENRLWQPKTADQNQLRDLQMEIHGLEKMIGQERARLKCGLHSQAVKISIQNTIEFLKNQQKELRRLALKLIRGNEVLARNFKFLVSQKGIGEKTAVFLLAKVPFEHFRKGRQIVSFGGIAAAEYSSGKSVHRKEHISRVGHASLRNAMYLPAITAMTHDPEIRAFKETMQKKGKPIKVIICAVMARMLRTCFALIRDQRLYQVRSSAAQLPAAA